MGGIPDRVSRHRALVFSAGRMVRIPNGATGLRRRPMAGTLGKVPDRMTDKPDMAKVIADAEAWRKSFDDRIPFGDNWLAHSDDDKRMRYATPEQIALGWRREAEGLAKLYADRYGDPRFFAAVVRRWVGEAGVDKHAWDKLGAIAPWLLRGETELPQEFRKWLADRLEGKAKRPRQGDRDPFRAWTIRLCIDQLLADHPGLKATRRNTTFGDDRDPRSACDALAKVWRLSPDTVETIWDSRPKT